MDKKSLRYTKEFKEKVLQEVLTGKLSCSAIARKHQVADWTVRRWKKELLNSTIEPLIEKSIESMQTLRLPKRFTYLQAYEAVCLSRYLSEEQFGAYCRKNGLLSSQVEEWKNWFAEHPNAVDIRELEQLKANNTEQKGLIAQQQAQLATKEKQIVKKDKALAQYATMLALSKKAEAIFAKEDS